LSLVGIPNTVGSILISIRNSLSITQQHPSTLRPQHVSAHGNVHHDGVNTHCGCLHSQYTAVLRCEQPRSSLQPQCILETMLSAASRSDIIPRYICSTCLRTMVFRWRCHGGLASRSRPKWQAAAAPKQRHGSSSLRSAAPPSLGAGAGHSFRPRDGRWGALSHPHPKKPPCPRELRAPSGATSVATGAASPPATIA
jgi:hypothetical protein